MKIFSSDRDITAYDRLVCSILVCPTKTFPYLAHLDQRYKLGMCEKRFILIELNIRFLASKTDVLEGLNVHVNENNLKNLFLEALFFKQ